MLNIKHIVVTLVALVCQPLFAQAVSPPRSEDEIRAILRQRIDIEHQSLGIVVGLIDARGKQVVGYGTIGDEGTSAPDGDTIFEIGSVTKVFTSLLLADMVQRGEVALTDPASKYLPATVKMPTRDGREITLLDLATHTSALPRMPSNFQPKDPFNPFADYTVEQMYDELSKCKLSRDIGSKYEYSNLATGLLGHILALRAGMDYEMLVATRIGKPLGLDSTTITLTPDARKHLALGHNQALAVTKNWDLPTLAGAGAIRSTANDMLKFVEINMGLTSGPLDAAMLEQQKTQRPTGIPSVDMALGWHKTTRGDGEIIWHNGQTGGYHSFIGFDKKRGVGVVVLSNCATDIDDIGLHLLDSKNPLKKNSPKKIRTSVKVDSKILDAYVGDYELAPTFVISITKEQDKLMLQATGQAKFEIFPESETDFFLKVVDAQVTFIKDDKETTTQLILHQNGRDLPAKKRIK